MVLMRKRRGASLLNVMVFLMFAVMVTAQVFFFSKSSSDSLAEEREIMVYRLNLNSLVEEAKDALKETDEEKQILHDRLLSNGSTKLTYSQFYEQTKVKNPNGLTWIIERDITDDRKYTVTIHDLYYIFDGSSFSTTERSDWTNNYSGSNKHKKLFAAMTPLSRDEGTERVNEDGTTTHIPDYKITNSFYLIRAYTQLPENFFNAKLMYQVLVKRDEDPASSTYHNVDVLSFQEVWY